MITLYDLKDLKLVQPENFGEEVTTLGALEHAITQGSQGWGVSPSIAVQLHIARDLQAALVKLDVAQKAADTLKGKQLELGRCKKQLATCQAKLDRALKAE